ncbi:protein of unknown function RIO1 [Methanococcus vannielii SB]|jgi:putative serine/threonine protein kinase|uniref:non-specific serine/threonine protein kinase n=1 Tax=Methanococcus vannielii (strain ATCC 35089 / DSM 1224 / JCM 13029 / OCM 148 / SB) TaxID=406327 RepID=A6UQQ4_METVS|nr:RIO1 family regulatory kinase/ATPase [Methanococcus vannielii]ABR54826.1 protein of unknown function RIO1 [Methanococcus vannielii SB]
MANSKMEIEITDLDNISSKLFDWSIVLELAKNMDFTRYVGKGHRGVVFKAISREYIDKNGNFMQLAVKIPRIDGPKNTIIHEGRILEKTNKFGVGPKVYEYSKNHLVMEYIDGKMLKDCMDEITPNELLYIIQETLRQCLKLDLHKIDHTEIQGGKHVMFSKDKVYIIDFDKAREHSPKNFTSAMSLLFGENYISKKTRDLLNISDNDMKIFRKLAKDYKILFKE